jgi:hypothetical protein
MGWVWSTHVEMHFVSALAWEVFGQLMLRCILFPRWHGLVMFLACLDAFLCNAYLEVGFGQQILRCIF